MRTRFLVAVTFGALAGIAGCTTGMTPASLSQASASALQPTTTTYSCADGGLITIENRGSSVRILNGADAPLELPASPPEQQSRYGGQSYALVLEGSEALFMKGGAAPVTCTR